MLKKDNTLFGLLIGLVLPAVFYGILSLIAHFVNTGPVWARPFETDRMMLLSIFINLLPIRLYFVSWKMEKTGRGVLLITVLLVIGYFAMKKFLV
jgi:hypothetical protein